MLTRVDQSLVQMLSEQNRTSQQQREGDQCPTSVLVSFIGRGRGSLGGLGLGEALWDENWSGLFFCFLSFIFPVIMSALQYLMTAHLFRQFQVALL